MSVESRMSVKSKKIGEKRWRLEVRSRIDFAYGLTVFSVLGLWFSAPLLFSMGMGLKGFLIFPTAFLFFGALAALLVARKANSDATGVLEIDAGEGCLRKLEGLTFLKWERFELPERFVLMADTIRVGSESNLSRAPEAREKSVTERYRLLLFPLVDDGPDARQQLWSSLLEFHEHHRKRTLKPQQKAALPEGAQLLAEGVNASFGRVLQEALTAELASASFDFTGLTAVIREPGERHSRVFSTMGELRQRLALEVHQVRRPFMSSVSREGEDLTIAVSGWSALRAVVLIISWSLCLAVFSALLWLMKGELQLALPVSYLFLVVVLIGLGQRLRLTTSALLVQPTLFGLIPTWVERSIPWDELGDIHVQVTTDGQAKSVNLALVSRFGGGRLHSIRLADKQAAKWLESRIAEYLEQHHSEIIPVGNRDKHVGDN